MQTVSQRELRNDNAAVIRAVVAGESVVVTRRGVPVARLVPFAQDDGLRCDRPARGRERFGERVRIRASESSEAVLADLRSDR